MRNKFRMTTSTELSIDERLRRARLRTTLNYYEEEFMKAVKNLGLIIKRIHDDKDKPWSLDYPTFEAYMEGRWGMSARRAYQLIAGEVTRDETLALAPPAMQPVVAAMKPLQLQEIAKVPAPARVEVIERVVQSGRKMTAETIRAAASTNKPLPPAPPRKKAPVIIDSETGKPEEQPRCCPHCKRPY